MTPDLQALSDAARERVIQAAVDVNALWSGEDGEAIRWEVEAGEALEDLRAAIEALDPPLRAATPVVPAERLDPVVVSPNDFCGVCGVRRGAHDLGGLTRHNFRLAASPSPDTDAGLDVERLARALTNVAADPAHRGLLTRLRYTTEPGNLTAAIAAEYRYARLTSEKGQPE